MARKRANGEGTAFKRKDGKWEAKVTVGRNPKTGNLKRKSLYGKTKAEVLKKMNEEKYKLQQGISVETTNMNLGQWLNTWLWEYKKNLKPKTFESYEQLIRVHILPSLGNIQLKALRPEHLQKFYNEKHSSGRVDGNGGLSARTVRYIHVVLHAALEQAVKNQILTRNVSQATTLPRQKKKEMRVLTKEEQAKLLAVLRKDEGGVVYILGLAAGMRRGELLGLMWKDIDFEQGIINVKRTLSRVKVFGQKNKTELVFQTPKSAKAIRSIPIPESILGVLKTHKGRQQQEKEVAGCAYVDRDLVFCTKLGNPIEPGNFTRRFYRYITKAFIAHTNPHALRHSYATRLLEVNEHPKIVQELLGHSSISLTLDTYSHVMPERKKAAAKKLNALFDTETPIDNDNTKEYRQNTDTPLY